MSKERFPERGFERHQEAIGPLSLPHELKDEKYHYRWVNYDPEKPFKLQQKISLGYDFIPVSEFESLTENMPNSPMFGGAGVDGTKICRKGAKGTVDYLMRCTKERHLENQAFKNKKAKLQTEQIKREAEKTRPGYGGFDESIGPLGFD